MQSRIHDIPNSYKRNNLNVGYRYVVFVNPPTDSMSIVRSTMHSSTVVCKLLIFVVFCLYMYIHIMLERCVACPTMCIIVFKSYMTLNPKQSILPTVILFFNCGLGLKLGIT